jgi:hypothetical protein
MRGSAAVFGDDNIGRTYGNDERIGAVKTAAS